MIPIYVQQLAMLLGEGTSSQPDASTPMTMTAAPKKMTPKRKLRIEWIFLELCLLPSQNLKILRFSVTSNL